MNRQERKDLASTTNFYEKKLEKNPSMARYLHFMAALSVEQGEHEKADGYYRRTMESDPANIMVRNDYAVHLAQQNRKSDAVHEINKARLIVDDNPLVQKNLAAILGNSGKYSEALEAATQARFLNPYDAQNHRNLAKLHAALGDARSALDHNMTAVQLEGGLSAAQADRSGKIQGKTAKTSSYRAAAVQIIAKGGRREEAFGLMDAARRMENQRLGLPTSQRTYEIIASMKRRYGSRLGEQERRRQEEEEKKRQYEAETAAYIKARLKRKS